MPEPLCGGKPGKVLAPLGTTPEMSSRRQARGTFSQIMPPAIMSKRERSSSTVGTLSLSSSGYSCASS